MAKGLCTLKAYLAHLATSAVVAELGRQGQDMVKHPSYHVLDGDVSVIIEKEAWRGHERRVVAIEVR